MKILCLLSAFCAFFPLTLGDSCRSEPKCRINRIKGMRAVDCYDKDLRELSQCYSSDMEILEFSKNRIRVIAKDDLKKYTNLKILYLHDNMIMEIHEEAFEGQAYLTALDLSLNSLSDLPAVILHLPSLKTLYLGQNWNMNIAEIVEKSKPITSPLGLLDLSLSSGKDVDFELPDLGIMPHLIQYNISGNNLVNLSSKQFAGMCNLKILATENVTAQYPTPCSCWTLNHWLIQRQVEFSSFRCPIPESECVMEEINIEDLQMYDCCKVESAEIKKSELTRKYLYISAGIVIAFLILIAIFLFVRRRNSSKPEVDQQYSNVSQNSESPKAFFKNNK